MGYLKKFFQRFFCKKAVNFDYARIELGPLKMKMKKYYNYERPHEISVIVPRVEMRKEIKSPFFTLTEEIIYNSVTIVNAPQAPLAGEGEKDVIIFPTQGN